MSHSILDPEGIHSLKYMITHVFCPLGLPDRNDFSISNDHHLAKAIATAARLCSDYVDQADIPQWHSISRMLENLQAITKSQSLDTLQTTSQFTSMVVGDILALFIRAQNAGVIFRKQKDVTTFEAFELSPKAKDVMTTEGKLICSYPGPAIEIPNLVFDENDHLSELVNFLVHMNHDDLGADTNKEQEKVVFQDTAHPRHITELLTGILRSLGRPANITRISKRIGDDVVCNNNSRLPWRRSSLWLLIRVALQTTLDGSPLGHDTYKEFILFFMCRLAEERACVDLPSDVLHFMSTKISRRLRKLGSSAPDWLSLSVLQACTSLRSTIENRWKQVQAAQRLSPRWTPSQLDLTRDTRLSLLESKEYLRNTLVSHSINPPDVLFNPEHHPRGALDNFLSSDAHFFDKAYCIQPHVTLYDAERAIEQGIDTWVGRVTNNDEACVKLEMLADKYSSSALKTYANNPELLSVMLLTTIELWVALDKIAIREIPMLADYSPEVPTSFLEHLLLCKTASLHRLRLAYDYISRRHSQSRSQWSVFSSTTTANSFSVRFFRKSPYLQRLKTRIEKVAGDEVREKVAELQEMSRNAHLSPYDPIRISVHEWPLPDNRLQAQAVVFELDCPISFNMWRTATFHLLVDLCSPPVQRDVPDIQLNSYHTLQSYLVEHPRARISLGSKTSASIDSLYIPAKREDVCIKNGLTFYGFDTRTGIPTSELGRNNSRAHCTYRLQSGPYHNLQKYVDSTSHTSNEVMANQVDCHKDLFSHEYMAFGHLRSGGLLQWLNILRELRARSLSFRRHEVHMLVAQAVYQVGPLSNTGWTWHEEIQQPAFCRALIGELRSLVQDVEANWLEAVTMDTVSLLLRRLLVSSPDEAVSLEALDLLRAVRGKVFTWVQELFARVIETPVDEELHGVLRDTAAICRSTFDVDLVTISKLLHTAEDIDVLLSSAMIIHDLMPGDVSCLPPYSQLLLNRDLRLSLALESVVSDIILTDFGNQGINLAVRRIWSAYCPGSKWTALQAPNSRWLMCTTAPLADQHSHAVHFNILDGSLFVDGKPFGHWLPNEFVRHPLYRLMFGEQMLKVIPGDLPGMDYSTRSMISDHQVYFSLRNGSDLIVRAKRNRTESGDLEIIELIPYEKLEGDLPAVLVSGHVHWLNLSTSIMEIRPLDSLWEPSPENWKIDCTPGHYHMWKGREFLVDVRSQSWSMVSGLLRPLGTPQDLIISVSPVDPSQPTSSLQLSALLPHYDLSFYVDADGDLQSRDIRGMVYDEHQSIGTLFGLVNQLVLRPKVKDVDALGLTSRCILIPDGKVSFRVEGHHVRVEITTDRSIVKRVTYHTYRVNTDLGCLTGDDSLTSKLYRAYLHSLTSGCSVDPLTGRSGTEEALSVLRSAGCWSTTRFSSRDAELLSLIASMCPSRTWQDPGKSMQRVEWNNLPINSQNHELYIICKAIKDHYERHQLFYQSQSSEGFPLQDDHLLKRGARRAAYLLPFEFSGQLSSAGFDVRYPARDVVRAGSAEHRAYAAATYIHHRTAMIMNDHDIWSMLRSSIMEVSTKIPLSLQYDRSWLAPNIPVIWLNAYNLLRQSEETKWFQLLFSLSAMAYASSESSRLDELVPVFIAFASHPQFRVEDPPKYDFYPLAEGCDPSLDILHKYIVDSAYPFEHSPERLDHVEFLARTFRGLEKHQRRMYNRRRRSHANAEARRFLHAWPCESCPTCSLDPDLYDLVDVESKVRRYFSNCFRNLKLKEHLVRVRKILNSLHSEVSPISGTLPHTFYPSHSTPPCIPWLLTVDQLFARPAPPLREHDGRLPRYADAGDTSLADSASLHQLIAKVGTNAVNQFQHDYVSALRTSAESFGNEMSLAARRATELPTAETLLEHYARCRANYNEGFHQLQLHLGPRSYAEQAVEQSGQWPRITAHAMFRCIASNSPIALTDDWKRWLIWFTLLALALQRARRLLLLHFENLHAELSRELQNEGCDGWDAEAHPDWLLIQLQCNFLIRRVQAEVANEMISPWSGDNTVMQLNMGEGKSSVIVPIVVAVLANGDQLVRVIVPKPLIPQTLHLLADRLGGLTNRRIYYLPFSRSLGIDAQKMAALRQIMLECMQEHGIMVVQPEHVLSLKLVSVEKHLSRAEDVQVGHLLLELQKWLHSRSRDILDESDEILDVRSQLIYTLGDQQHVEGYPERWTTTKQVLTLVSKHASSLRERFPLEVEYEPGTPGSFPRLRILQVDAGKALISWIVEDIIDGHLPNINFGQLHLHSGLRDAIRSFISCKDVAPETHRFELAKKCIGQTPLWGGLLLLRGLFAHGILLIAFRERRWRVDYGLAPERTMLAVPYRAKDVPARRAEFGHPDVAIILTCLSYYYGGLTEEQLKLSFQILLRQHDPSLDYDLWVGACPGLPESLRVITGVNVDSSEQWNGFLFPLFSRNRATIDFYLSRVVFPREAKEFPLRLSSSGWDLAEKKERLVTGFSGTNDGQHLLPIHITQRDPDHQLGTNAKVLAYLLQPENRHYMCMANENGKQRNIREFLQILVAQKPEIRVLLDIGAQMLDLQNYELVKAWLDITPNASAAIYFNEDDELMVCTRDGSPQLLRSSPFAQQLDRCVVYLDDAHTRGTDIKFPNGFRAAVTLGPRINKDRLVQGCMRMRMLGYSHSIMFFAPLDVDRHIRSVVGKKNDPSDVIDTMDILNWAIRETWVNIQRWAPHWVQQGMDHTSRYAAWTRFRTDQLTSKELSDQWRQREAKGLEELYEPRTDPSNSAFLTCPDEVRQRCIDLGVKSLSSAGLDEEQERELVYEVKREREVERPSSVPPADHSIHQDVAHFVKTGVIPKRLKFSSSRTDSEPFSPVFTTLRATSAATDEAYVWSQSVLATTDFQYTVKVLGKMDDYLRPVHWVVSAKRKKEDSSGVLVILSPYEVNRLLPDIRSSKKVHLHLYTARITKSMKPCDDLAFYSIPPVVNRWIPPSSFMDELSVFAGQLYMKDYETYIRLCRFLRVRVDARNLKGEEEPDGFILVDREKLLGTSIPHTFSITPIVFLKALMNLRSKDIDFTSTHMGKLVHERPLSERDFDL